jgi:hypothetical protein
LHESIRGTSSCFSPAIHTLGFYYVAPRVGARFSTWALFTVAPLGLTLRGPDTLPVVPGDVRLGAASVEAAGTEAVPMPLAVALSVSLGFFSQRGDSPSVRQRCCPTWRPSALSPLPSCEAPFLVGSGAEEYTPAFAPLTGRPAARHGLFAHGGSGFTHRLLDTSALCLCRKRLGPGSGHWPGRLVACSIELPESDKSNSLALRLLAVACRSLWETVPSRQSRFGARWPGQWVFRQIL